MSAIEITYHEGAEKEVLHQEGLAAKLELIGMAITAAAVPYTNVDQGFLIASMGSEVVDEGQSLTLVCGPGVGLGSAQPPEYWAYQLAGEAAPNQSSLIKDQNRPPTRPHTIKGTPPTHSYKNALTDLGIDSQVEPGGFEA